MNADDAAPARRPALRELFFPLVALAWRIAAYDLRTLWRDWVVWIALYWIFTVFGRRTRAWAPVTVILSIGLLGIYLSRQFEHTLDSLRFAW